MSTIVTTNIDENNANTSTQSTITTTIDPLKVLPLEHLNNSKTESPPDINVTIEASTASTSSLKSNSTLIKLDEIENKKENENVDKVMNDKENDNTVTTTEILTTVPETSTQSIFVSTTQTAVTTENAVKTDNVTTFTIDKGTKIESSTNIPVDINSENHDTKINQTTTLTPDEDELKVTTIMMEMNDGTELPVEIIPTLNKGRAIDLNDVKSENISSKLTNNNDTTVMTTTVTTNAPIKEFEAIKLLNSSGNPMTEKEMTTVHEEPIDTVHNDSFHDLENHQGIISDDICTKNGILYKVSFFT